MNSKALGLSILIILASSLLICACSSKLPAESEIRQLFIDNKSEFEKVKDNLVADTSGNLVIHLDGVNCQVDYAKKEDKKLSDSALESATKLMKRLHFWSIRKVYDRIYFDIAGDDDSEKAETFEIVYDGTKFENGFNKVKNSKGFSSRFSKIDSNWGLVHCVENK